MATTVEVLVEAIRDWGTPFIVGHPGGESAELMDAARQRGMRFILMKQETAGAILAATWGEITGSPGVCLSTRGPGVSNMTNGVAHAWLDRSPLIVITDQYPPHIYEVGLRQRVNHLQLYSSITKWGTTIGAKTVRQQVRRALRTATAHPPGPVHFDLPSSETMCEVADTKVEALLVPNIVPVIPDRGGLQTPLRMLESARRPVLLAGLGVLWSKASKELVALAERLSAPVLTTTKGKGIIPEDHPLRAGCIIGGRIERDLINKADLIVTIGLDAVELQPKPWPYALPVLALSTTLSLDALIPASAELVGDLKPLLACLAEWAPVRDWGEFVAREFREQVITALDTPSTGLSAQRVVEIARAILPRDTIATCDAGLSRLLVVQKWQTYGPREFLTSNGLGSMGYAIPGALGARLANPAAPVVAFAGDGGFLMAVAELQTSVRESLPIIVIVFDDAEIGLIRVKQQIKGIPIQGVKLGGLNWEHLAQGFGADVAVVDSENTLDAALRSAVKSERTTVIATRIDTSGYVAQFNALREL